MLMTMNSLPLLLRRDNSAAILEVICILVWGSSPCSAKTDTFDSHILQTHLALCTQRHGNLDQDVALFGEASEERWGVMPGVALQHYSQNLH